MKARCRRRAVGRRTPAEPPAVQRAARPADLSENAAGVTPTEQTRFTVDADGVVTASLDVAFALAKGTDRAKLRVRARLEREAIEQVDDEGVAAFTAGPISGFANFERARRNADESFVAGTSLEDLLAEVKRSLAMSGSQGGNARAQVLARLGALVRLQPETAEEGDRRAAAPATRGDLRGAAARRCARVGAERGGHRRARRPAGRRIERLEPGQRRVDHEHVGVGAPQQAEPLVERHLDLPAAALVPARSRAWSTSRQRIVCAATAKKWLRSLQLAGSGGSA